MAHLMKSAPLNSALPVMWNVDNSVGYAGANVREDVYLVQYLLNMTGRSPKTTNIAIKAKLTALKVTGICDAYTIECIRYGQTLVKEKVPGTIVDGRVSRAAASLSYGGSFYCIASFNLGYRNCYWENWPAICADTQYTDATITNLVYRELFGTEPV